MRLSRSGEQVRARDQDRCDQHNAGQRGSEVCLCSLKPGASTVTTELAANAMISEPRPRTNSVTVSTDKV